MLNRIKGGYEELLMLAVGIICVTLNVHIYGWFPILFGLFMLERGLHGCYIGWKNGDAASREQKQLPISLMMVAIAIGIMVLRYDALLVAGMFWGLSGMYKSAGFLNEILYRFTHKEKYVILPILEFVIEAPLSMLLIFDPENSIEHHIIILGAQLIVYSVIGMIVKSRERI